MIVSLLLFALILLGIYIGSHPLSGVQTGLVAGGALVGLTLVIFPGLASYAARIVGVGRGTDLLLYAAIVAGLFVAAHLYFRTKQQERQIVELTRAVALGYCEPKSASEKA